MQGFILSLQPVRDEDLWVRVLTAESLLSLYRFYGARHSVIALGHKIDFCVQTQGKRGILCLRDAMHLGFLWEDERTKKLVWQDFIRLLFAHLKDVEHIEPFYYTLLCEMTHKMHKQNPHRIACEAYAKILALRGVQMSCKTALFAAALWARAVRWGARCLESVKNACRAILPRLKHKKSAIFYKIAMRCCLKTKRLQSFGVSFHAACDLRFYRLL